MSVAINLIAIFSPFQQILPHFTKDYYTTEKAQSTDEKIPQGKFLGKYFIAANIPECRSGQHPHHKFQ